jgi:predicted LPLAT superfamily acyltransferase
MAILLKAYALGGKPLFQLCLWPVSLFYSLFHPVASKASLQYRRIMAAANSDFPKPKPWHSFVHLWSFANTLLDKLAVWMGKIQYADVDIHHAEIMDNLMAEGRGAVILISHLGNFEVCQALSENRPSLRLCVLEHSKNTEKFNRFVERHSAASHVDFMQVTDLGVAQAMILNERLKQGHFIGIGADRVPVDNPGRTAIVNFLGRPAAFPEGPFSLAMTLQVPLISIQCIKEGGRYQIYFEQLADGEPIAKRERPEKLRQMMAAYVDNLERYCRKAPWQWYNFYPFWQQESSKP